MNYSCLISTIIAGSFVIFPLFFMCCSWWKKMVTAAYDIPLSTYQSLEVALAGGSAKVLTLTVTDSTHI